METVVIFMKYVGTFLFYTFVLLSLVLACRIFFSWWWTEASFGLMLRCLLRDNKLAIHVHITIICTLLHLATRIWRDTLMQLSQSGFITCMLIVYAIGSVGAFRARKRIDTLVSR